MKFLCPSCKAKYQIADEKVAGRSVRMKCRKCGYLISISKTVTEGSAAHKLEGLSERPPPPSTPAPPSSRTPPPSSQRWREPGRPAPAARAPAAPARPPAPRAAPPRAAAPVRPAPAPAPAARPAPPPPRARTGTAPLAAASSGLESAYAPPPAAKPNGNGASAQHVAAALAGSIHHYDEDRTVISTSSPLSHAFAESVGPESSLAASLAQSGDEWYVGINGVPVGPIRLSELRSKAAAGAITTESLVWRDGFEQWMNLRLFPELVAIVEEGVSSARASLTPLSPSLMPTPSAPPAAPRPEVYDPFKLPSEAGAISDPFKSGPQVVAAPLQSAPTSVGFPQTGPGVVTDDFQIPKRGGVGVAAWVAVGVALALGLTVGFVVFSKTPPEPIVKYVEVPAKSAAGTAPLASGTEIEETEVTADGGIRKIAKVGGPLPTKTSDKPGEKGLNLGDLQGGGVSGPNAGSGSTGSANTSGQPLDSASIQKTVGRYTGSVKRSCWQPALDGRSKDAPSSARVSVSIVVSPSGSVQSATTSGDPKGYPGLASCIASRVRGWQFPASSGTTTVNVPFVFAAQ